MTPPRRVAVNEVAEIERDIVNPAAIETGTLYVGLENIESGGRFVGVRPVDSGELASSKFAFTSHHVLYGKLRPYLAKIARPDFEGICSTDILPVLPGPDLDRGYLAWILLTPEMVAMANSRATGANLPRLSPTALGELKIPLPELPGQRRIAGILDKADAVRSKRRAALAQLDALTDSIFLDMFGDPRGNPRGWPQGRLDSICDLVNGRAFKPDEWEEVGLPIIRIQNLNDVGKPFNYTTQNLPARFRVHTGDILFSWSGTPGTSFGCSRWIGPTGWLNQHIFNVHLNEKLDGEFFITQVNLKLGELIAKAHGGVGLQHVTKGMVDETILMIPPMGLQREFALRVATLDSVRSAQGTAERELDALFASIQYRAFRGELV